MQQFIAEPSPSTVNYRYANINERDPLKTLIDGNYVEKQFKSQSSGEDRRKLDWIEGVFMPVLLNIWGAIMFLRIGWVVGQAGLLLGTVVLTLSNVVTFVTTLSLCAICTNGDIEGGGIYFIISRSLGPVYGGTIGILSYIAFATSVAMNAIGFAEAMVDLIADLGGNSITGDEVNDARVIGLITVTLLFVSSLFGIGWFAKTQIGLLVTLMVALLCVLLGSFVPKFPDEQSNSLAGFVGYRNFYSEGEFRNLKPNFQVDSSLGEEQTFFSVFSVYFPSVTGIMAGASLSGDLQNPSQAIPKGTILAVLVSFVSYYLLLWAVGLTCLSCVELTPNETFTVDHLSCSFDKLTNNLLHSEGFVVPGAGLLYDNLIMKHLSLWPYIIYIGIAAAALSSALGALVGAPRILQAVAADKLFPWTWFNFFAKGQGPNNEPIRGYCLTFVIACCFVAIGQLDIIAPIISNFFIISYCITNWACFQSSYYQLPSWRPSFKYYDQYSSLFGFLLCLAVMFAMDWLYTLVTLMFSALIMFYLQRLNPDMNWGEVGEAIKYSSALEKLESLQLCKKDHVKTFRPQFLVLSGETFRRIWLVKFVSLFQAGKGMMLCTNIININRDQSAVNSFKTEEPQVAESTNNSSLHLLFNGLLEENSKDNEEIQNLGVIETAQKLAEEYELVKSKRFEGDWFLNNRTIWGGGRCKGSFFDAMCSPTLFDGFEKALQLSGLGKLRPNVVVLGFKKNYMLSTIDEIKDYEKLLRSVLAVQMGLVVVRDDNFIFDLNFSKTLSRVFPSSSGSSVASETITEASVEGEEEIGSSRLEINLNALHEKFEMYKSHNIEYISKFEGSLPLTIPGELIDVWWLADDGGLTMLLPQLLIQNPLLRGKKLRVMTVTSKFHDPEQTSRLKKAELRMIHLLSKFRIKASTVGVDVNIDTAIAEKTKDRFENCLGLPISELEDSEKAKTFYQLRLSEELRKVSKNSSLVFMVIPLPDITLRVKLHTVWLDMFSYDMPPMIMLRGNNQNVLTFFC